MYELEPGIVESFYVAPEHFQGYPGVLHGGIVGALIDEISGRAHMGPESARPRLMFTARMEVRYRKHVPIGRPLRIVGRAGRSRGKTAEAWGGIYLAGESELLAEGNTLLVDIREGQFGSEVLSELGWRVYPD